MASTAESVATIDRRMLVGVFCAERGGVLDEVAFGDKMWQEGSKKKTLFALLYLPH